MNLKGRPRVVIGLGYVGLPLAVEFAKHRLVIGYDHSSKRIKDLIAYKDSTREVSVTELKQSKLLRLTDNQKLIRDENFIKTGIDLSGSIKNNQKKYTGSIVFIVTVPTPIDKFNQPDLSFLINASETVGRLIKENDVVIYESTVYPGVTEDICVPIIEKISGLKYAKENFNLHTKSEVVSKKINSKTFGRKNKSGVFYAGYSPERINPGDRNRRISGIKKITSGSTMESAKAIDKLYSEIIKAGTYLASSIKVAEAAKVIENSQRDLNIAFVNELSIIFNLMGLDTQEVLAAAETKWNFISFKPGLVGGHCIGVDPYYLTHRAQELGYKPRVILAGRSINNEMGINIARNLIREMMRKNERTVKPVVGILGVTFKENCPDVRNTRVIDIINELISWGIGVSLYDPEADIKKFQEESGHEVSNSKLCNEVDALIVAVQHKKFMKLTPLELKKMCKKNISPIIVDVKGMYDKAKLEKVGFNVYRL